MAAPATASPPAGTARRVNLALLVLVPAALATGVIAYATGARGTRAVTIAHAAVGLALLATAPWKASISRRGLDRRGLLRAAPSLLLAVAITTTLVSGIVHGIGMAPQRAPITTMQVHVGAAVIALALLAWHAVARPVRRRPGDLSRRAFLQGAAAVAAGGGAALAIDALAPILTGQHLRSTGSYRRGDAGELPVTQWLFDGVPAIDGAAWRLRLVLPAGERALSLDDVSGWSDEVDATIDCTGGWYATRRWRGARLSTLLDGDGAAGRSIEVRSSTGYARRFPRRDADHLWLATHVDGAPLPEGNGFPVRLVAPGRRGFWWVKWVEEVRVDDQPWWWQPPFPLQ